MRKGRIVNQKAKIVKDSKRPKLPIINEVYEPTDNSMSFIDIDNEQSVKEQSDKSDDDISSSDETEIVKILTIE